VELVADHAQQQLAAQQVSQDLGAGNFNFSLALARAWDQS
jgi:hypothetical protein